MNGNRSRSGSTSTDAVHCAHCTHPVPAAERRDGEELQFCCSGCRAVHASIHACGLEGYYDLRRRLSEREEAEGGSGREDGSGRRDDSPARVSGRGFESFDEPAFLGRHARSDVAGRCSGEFRIDGIRCGACVWLLEAMPRIEHGVEAVRVDPARGTVRIAWNPERVRLSSIARRFDTLGYQLVAFADPAAVERERAVHRAWLVRIGVSGAIASNAMAVAFALYGGLFAEMAPAYRMLFQWVSVTLAIVALSFPGRVFLANALASIRTRTPHMDLPVAFGLVAAIGAGIVATVRGAGSIYCESASMLVFLLLVGRYVQYGRQRKAREQVELLLAIVPSIARRVRADGSVQEVSIDALLPGERVEVTAGETCPADGRLLSSAVHVDLAHLTGESVPVRVERGAPVYAGSRFTTGPVEVEVVVAGSETRAARLLELVRDASQRRAPVEELANRMAGWFLVGVIVSAATTLAWWWPTLGPEESIERAIAMLVVTCPCALGLATPLAVVAGLGKGARRGVLVKGGDILERAATPGTLVLDKTGTVTEARSQVVRSDGAADAVALAAALEIHSTHPLAFAIQRAVDEMSPDAQAAAREQAHDVHETPGMGIEGRVAGKFVRVGNMRFMQSRNVIVSERFRERAREFAADGLAPVVVAVQGRAEAMLGIGDPIRADAAETVGLLCARGWRVMLASGDDPVVAAGVGRAIGLAPSDAVGGLSPEEKLEFVRRADLARPVVMVGDGVNDLAALAAADVGVAVRNGAQASHHVADVCLAASGMRPLARFLEGSRTTMGAIRTNLAVSVAYNAFGGALAFAGLVNPLVAAIIMPLSGLTVLVLALRLPSFELPSRAEGKR
jgi:Cu2+-exporting ATPase